MLCITCTRFRSSLFVYWSLTSPFVTVMDISATDRNPEPGDDPLLFSTDSKGSFRCTQPQTVMHATKPLFNQLGTTGICPHRSNQPIQDIEPGTFWSRVTDPMRVTTEWGRFRSSASKFPSGIWWIWVNSDIVSYILIIRTFITFVQGVSKQIIHF